MEKLQKYFITVTWVAPNQVTSDKGLNNLIQLWLFLAIVVMAQPRQPSYQRRILGSYLGIQGEAKVHYTKDQSQEAEFSLISITKFRSHLTK